jgi:SAM-dependent methyltransferase
LSRVERFWFLAGLFLTTLATLTLEILNTRLLSVTTWYHLSFFAVSTAMFGLAAGGLRVYLAGARYDGDAARRGLARGAVGFTLAIPAAHVAILYVPIRLESALAATAEIALATALIAVPFYLAGIVIALALTRIPGRIGIVYAVDLLGAALGCLIVVPLLYALDISSATLLCGAIAALGALCFRRLADRRGGLLAGALALLLACAGLLNAGYPEGLRVVHTKGRVLNRAVIADEFWTPNGQVMVFARRIGPAFFWGAGRGADAFSMDFAPIQIDGAAGTAVIGWDGETDSLDWTEYDVTSLPYHLRPGGDAAVIGVGGGRDLLTALRFGSRSVTGIEVNRALIHLLNGPYRDYAKLADRPEVTLVHDEARSFLTRTEKRFDVLQMSLIDTWAATGAGAFTLSENGLYTREAWREFLNVLAPGGIFSVSRWYSPDHASETSRLIALATAALLDRGVADPRRHMVLVSKRTVATLLVSPQPLASADYDRLAAVAERFDFKILLGIGHPPATPELARIGGSASLSELEAAVAHPRYDYAPPTDRRPYFFNLLKPRALLAAAITDESVGVVATGNLLATRTLVILWAVSFVLVTVVIAGPLLVAGLPRLAPAAFAEAVAYFAAIGFGYMLVQIAFMQRFSVYLGHPTYAVSAILFSMILSTGIGSALSDRVPAEADRRWLIAIPIGIASLLLTATVAIQPLIEATIHQGLAARCATAVGVVFLCSLPLGLCFPIGLRLVQRLSDDATPWMWGVNGACGVLATVSAIGISMWSGIHVSLYAATVLYALLSIPAVALQGRVRGSAASPAPAAGRG